jgi:outer membrane protein OmpA-like peptidoglycan-associated protein
MDVGVEPPFRVPGRLAVVSFRPEWKLAERRSRESPMKTNFDANTGPMTGSPPTHRRGLKASPALLVAAMLATLPAAQPVLAQQTVHIGGQGATKGVIVNLSAIYGGSGANYAAPARRFDPAMGQGGRRLLIPNLRLTAPTRQFTLRQPSPTSAPTSTPNFASAAPEAVARAAAATRAPVAAARPAAKAPPPDPRVASSRPPAPPAPPKPAGMSKPEARKPVMEKSTPAKLARLAPPPPPTVAAPTITSVARRAPAPAAAKLSPPPPVEAKKAVKRQRVAALPPPGDGMLQIRFRKGSSVLTRDDESRLKDVAKKIESGGTRVQLKAYADGTGKDTSRARRLSLSRALAVRSFLIENGLRSTRIDVRALGIARDGGPPDRVDIVRLDR